MAPNGHYPTMIDLGNEWLRVMVDQRFIEQLSINNNQWVHHGIPSNHVGDLIKTTNQAR